MMKIARRVNAVIFLVAFVISLSATTASASDMFRPLEAEDVVNVLYALDGEPLMLDQDTEKPLDVEKNPESWSAAYNILPEEVAAPDGLTQAEIAVILYRYAEHHDVDLQDYGADTTFSFGEEELTAVSWALDVGILPPEEGTAYQPNQLLTQDDLAAVIQNYQSAQLPAAGVEADGLTLIYPSEDMHTISPLCDFYVIGDVEDTVELPDDARLTVQLVDDDGTLMREIYTEVKDNQAGMYVDYPEITITGSREAFRASLMPDLVYDPADPSTFDNTWIKAYYTDEHYTCVVYGGSYRQNINPVDQFGNTLEPLPEGDYDLTVTMESDGDTLAHLTTQITIGVVPEKVLSRFSPAIHLQNVEAYANLHDLVIFTDPYAGYWDTMQNMPEWGIDYIGTIERRWTLVDREGYIGGMTYFFDYNISEGSVSYRVELGQLGYLKDLDNRNSITYCYYDIGEPVIEQHGETYYGSFVTKNLDQMDPLLFTRVDISTADTAENTVSPEILADATSVFDLDTRFTANPGDILSVNGICQVIQPETVTFLPDTESFQLGNRIAGVRYTVRDAFGTVLYTIDKPVSGLARTFSPGYTSISILEFRHNFTVEESMRGSDIRIFATALDLEGNPVGSPLYVCMFRVPRA